MLRSAPREDAFDERCGASRCRFHGLPAGRLGSGRAGGGRLRPDAQVASLRASDESLEGRANAATLELYALEAELGQARSAAASIAARQAVVERDRAAARKQLAIARNAVHVSETRLAELVRALYEQSGQADPLAILLGAESLEEALTGLDSLSRAAGQNNRIIEQARSSRKRLAALDDATRRARGGAHAARRGGRCARPLARGRGRDAQALRRGPPPPAGAQRGPDRLDRGPGAKRGGADDGDRDHGRARHDRRFGAGRDERPDDHRQLHRLLPARAHRHRPPDRPRRRRRRSVGDPPRDADDDPRLRRGDRSRHRRRRAREHDRPLVLVDAQAMAWGRRTVTITIR